MANTTLDGIVKERTALEKTVDELEKQRKVLQTRIDKTMGEYRMVKEGLEEGAKHIDELKKELSTAYDTWQKMFTTKLPQVKAKMADVAKEVGKVRPDLKTLDKEATDLIGDLARCGGDLKDVKAENDTLKGLQRTAARLTTDYNQVEDQATSVPADPKEPSLKIA